MNDTITAVQGLQVGHYTNTDAITGCTVVLCPEGATGGVDVRGAAPGTRETDLLNPLNTIQAVHAVLLTGGSAFGLDAAGGVMRWLEERDIGFAVGVGVVPIVPAAVLFDLAIGDPQTRPGPDDGYAACDAANSEPVTEGNVGAGTGATVGKALGPVGAIKSGLGSAHVQLADGTNVGALVAVNAMGDVIDPDSGTVVAGVRNPEGTGFLRTSTLLQGDLSRTMFGLGGNTTLAVVATDAQLSKVAVNKMAQMAHDGLARSINPVHTMFDGDTVFALATGASGQAGNAGVIGAVAATVLAQAVVRAVRAATSLGGLPAARDI